MGELLRGVRESETMFGMKLSRIALSAALTIGAATLAASGSFAATSTNGEILADHPAAYYPMSDATDQSGHGNPSLVQAGSGTGVTFGATGAQATSTLASGKYLRATLAPAVTPRTVEVFFTSSATTMSELIYAGNGTVGNGLRISVGATSVIVDSGSFSTMLSGIHLTDGKRHQLAAVINGSTADIYIDGVLRGSGSAAAPTSASLLQVGPFSGVAAHAAIYTTALSSTRIAAHYAAATNKMARTRCGERHHGQKRQTCQ